MNNFVEIINTYLKNYDKYEKGKVEFECEFGELIFLKENKNIITVFGIYIFPEYRQQGFCKNILIYLIDNCINKFDYLCIQSVLSKILYNYLLRFTYKNRKFIKTRSGFVYKIK